MRLNPTLILLLAAMTWLLVGCESDTTAPQDDLPPLSNENVANQSGFLAVALVRVAPVGLTFEGSKADGEYTYDFAGDVEGRVYLQFRQGGEEGDPHPYDTADWARARTAAGEPVVITLVPDGGLVWGLNFNLVSSDINRETGTATVNGGGSLVIDGYPADWTLEGLVVYDTDDTTWPGAGTLTFQKRDIIATIEFNFDGDHGALVRVGVDEYILNLENGSLEPVVGD